MAIYFYPDVNDEAMVCQEACAHKDCAEAKRTWPNNPCVTCGEVLQSGDPIYWIDSAANKAQHVRCG